MDAVKSPAPPSHTLRQWRRPEKNQNEAEEEDGLGMCLPLGLNAPKPPLRKPVLPLTSEEIAEIENDRSLDKGYTVWRSLPMESDLDKKLKVNNNIHRTADFTKQSKPEAYLPGFTARASGPINRPHNVPARSRVQRAPVVASQAPVKAPAKPPAESNNDAPGYSMQATTQQIPLNIRELSDAARSRREGSDMSTTSSHGIAPQARQGGGGVLTDSVLKK